jgi:uncharacterized protein YecE (DUF72 family)
MPTPKPPNLFIGTSGYAYKEWKGSFYPKDLPASQMLPYYAERFRAVEINASFYRLPGAATLNGWAAQVPADFKFTLKAPQQITHFKRLKAAAAPTKAFIKVAATLGDRLGPLLFGLPPNMKKDVPRLEGFLAKLPSTVRVAFEFRHQSWLEDDVFSALRTHTIQGAALCIADDDNDLKVPFEATATWGYLRLRRAKYTGPQLKQWAARVQAAPWKEAYVFFKHEETGTGPRFARNLIELAV